MQRAEIDTPELGLKMTLSNGQVLETSANLIKAGQTEKAGDDDTKIDGEFCLIFLQISETGETILSFKDNADSQWLSKDLDCNQKCPSHDKTN